MLRSRALVVAVACLLVAGAACSNGDDGGSSTGSTNQPDQASTTAPSSSDEFNQAFDEGTPKEGGSIKIGVEADIASLDPAGALAQVSDYDIALAIYDPLVDYDANGDLAPSLATKWSGSPDLRTWTLELRTGVTFSDGTPFNADAVVQQFTRLKDPATKCVCASNVSHITKVEAE